MAVNRETGWLFLPYCIEDLDPEEESLKKKRWAILNRHYRPWGMRRDGILDDSEFLDFLEPFAVVIPGLTEKARQFFNCPDYAPYRKNKSFYLFNDGTAPWSSAVHFNQYMNRYRRLISWKMKPADKIT